jgi:hypothetical protein
MSREDERNKNDIAILITNHLSLKPRKKEKRKKAMTNLKQWLLGMIIIFVVLPIKVTLEFVQVCIDRYPHDGR